MILILRIVIGLGGVSFAVRAWNADNPIMAAFIVLLTGAYLLESSVNVSYQRAFEAAAADRRRADRINGGQL